MLLKIRMPFRGYVMITINFKNVDNMEESKETEFGFSGRSGVIRNEEGSVIGFFTIDVDIPEIKLEELEILEKYRDMGYGRSFIGALFKKYPMAQEITGIGTEESEGFYDAIGAEIYSVCDTCEETECTNSPKCIIADDGNLSLDSCDEYSGCLFKIERKSFAA